MNTTLLLIHGIKVKCLKVAKNEKWYVFTAKLEQKQADEKMQHSFDLLVMTVCKF